MTLPEFALDYSSCSHDELRRCVADRTGREPKGRGGKRAPKKTRLIQILRGLDRNMAGFRFLDLPPEMRNNVYEMLLTQDESKDLTAYPALLRTCKQIHHEGSPILHDGKIAELQITFVKGWHRVESINQPCADFDRSCCTSYSRGLVYADENNTIDAFSYHMQVVDGFRTIHLSLDV